MEISLDPWEVRVCRAGGAKNWNWQICCAGMQFRGMDCEKVELVGESGRNEGGDVETEGRGQRGDGGSGRGFL